MTPAERPDERAILAWHDAKWPDKTDITLSAKLAEETGEVCGAAIKTMEGRRTEQDLKDELGDVLIVASVIAARHGWTLSEVRSERFAEVEAR